MICHGSDIGNVASPDNAIKNDASKVRLDLLPVRPILDVGQVLTFGAVKYQPRNWEKGLFMEQTIRSTPRLIRMVGGETLRQRDRVEPFVSCPVRDHVSAGVFVHTPGDGRPTEGEGGC